MSLTEQEKIEALETKVEMLERKNDLLMKVRRVIAKWDGDDCLEGPGE